MNAKFLRKEKDQLNTKFKLNKCLSLYRKINYEKIIYYSTDKRRIDLTQKKLYNQ